MTVETRPLSPPTTPVGGPRWPDLQGLRAVAVTLAVVPPTRYAGLTLFLALSGYVITRKFDREPLRYSDFCGRRIQRLTPALTGLLLVAVTLAFFLESPLRSGTTRSGLTLAAALAIETLALPLIVLGARRYRRPRELLAAVMVAGTALALGLGHVWPAAGTAFAAGALLAVVAGDHPQHPHNPLAWRPLTWVGDRSYSIYLWQWPVPGLTAQVTDARWAPVAAGVLALLPAYLSHRYLEHRRPSLTVCAAIAAGVTALAIAATLVQPLLIHDLQTFRRDERRPTFARAKGCLVTGRAYHPDDIERCTVRVPHAKGWILLAGDDRMSSFSSGVIRAARESRYDTVSLQGQDCPFARTARSRAVPNCGELSGELLDRAVGANPPALAIIGAGTPAGTVSELKAAAVPVLTVADVPHLPCRGGVLLFTCTSGRERPAPEQRLALDPARPFCHDGTCSPVLGGHLAYADPDHLNVLGSEALAADFNAEIAATERNSGNLNSPDRLTAPR